MKNAIILLILIVSTNMFAQDITGKWYGKINVMGTELLFGLDFSKKDAVYSGTMDIPQQNAKGIPLTSVTFDQKKLVFRFDPAQFAYTGELKDTNIFEGVFSQNGQNYALQLSREKSEEKKLNRPQEPKGPFPYAIEEVVFENEKDKITLAGTLTTPQKEDYPVAILISGSGPQDRNSEILGHKPFWVIADYLTRNGIGVLRIDDRGVGKSGGHHALSTSYDFAADVESAVRFLKSKKGVNPKKIGLIGHSEGGIIAPVVASKDKSIHFLVLLAAPGIPCDELMLQQTYLIGKVSGMNANELAEAKKINQRTYAIVKSNKTDTDAQQALEVLFTEMYSQNPEFVSLSEADKKAALRQQIAPILSPWYRNFIRFEPSVYLEKVSCPVLALNGEKDLQVPSNSNLEGIQKALKKGGNKKVTVKEYSGLNHLFQACETGSAEEYGAIEQTFSPVVLTDIKDWILNQAN